MLSSRVVRRLFHSPHAETLVMDSNARVSSRRLPVPVLRQTLDKYLKSLDPFLRQQEEDGGPSRDIEIAKRAQWATNFEHGIGRALQGRLLALDKASPYNWLDDNFWMNAAYLQSRSSLLVNSNWWCVYQPDSSIPSIAPPETGHYTFWQVRRAAWLVHRMLKYRAELESKATQKSGSVEVPFQMPFYRCRIPRNPCDALATPPRRGTPESRKIILMLRDWFYVVEVLDSADMPVPVAEIEARIRNAVHDANARRKQGEEAVPVGVLTAHDRTAWAKAREHLTDISPRNRETLSAIENSIFAISLDDYTQTPHGESTSITDKELDAHVRNASSGKAGRNRWYDKCVSIFVESNTRAGGMGEHSPCDGLVVGAMMHHSLCQNIDNHQFEGIEVDNLVATDSARGWERLDWVTDDHIATWCVEAEREARSISSDSDASMLSFNEYGALWIKDIAKLSPDAYAQLAMQLAWYKDQGEFTATYETASTQMFLHGRTETVRSFSTESWLFVKAMLDPRCPTLTRLRLLKDGVRTHNSATREAIKGKGIDRHLLGLRLLMKEGETAQLFQDPLFSHSETWRLSTSGLFRGEKFLGTGFGSPLWDGYGIQYILDPELLKVGVESKRSCPITSTERYKEALVASLREMRMLCETDARVEDSARL